MPIYAHGDKVMYRGIAHTVIGYHPRVEGLLYIANDVTDEVCKAIEGVLIPLR